MPYIDFNRDTLVIGHGTDAGQSGKNNEDDYGVFETQQQLDGGASLLPVDAAIVADGIGGSSSGEVASKMAVETIIDVFIKEQSRPIHERLELAIRAANRDIFVAALENPAMRGMGTTAVVSAIIGDYLYIAHAGDSRAYLMRDNELYLLTLDHTWAQEAIDAGRLTLEQAQQHPNKNVIKRFLGPTDHVDVDHRILAVANRTGNAMLPEHRRLAEGNRLVLQSGDIILLCSDGLTDVVSDAQILSILKKHEPTRAVNRLIRRANAAGGPDNITVVLQQLVGGHQSQPMPHLNAAQTYATDPTVPLDTAMGTGPATFAPADFVAADRNRSRRGGGLWILLAMVLIIAVFGAAFWLNLLPWQERFGRNATSEPTGAPAVAVNSGSGTPIPAEVGATNTTAAPDGATATQANGGVDERGSGVQTVQIAPLVTQTSTGEVIRAAGATAIPTLAAMPTTNNVGETTSSGAARGENSGDENSTGENSSGVTPSAASAVATLPGNNSPALQSTSTSAIPSLTPTPTATSTPTPTPTPSITPLPSATLTPSITPIPTTAVTPPAAPTRTATAGNAAIGAYAATYPIILSRPGNGEVLKDSYEFEWITDYPLASGQGLELAFWPASLGRQSWKAGRSPVGALMQSSFENFWRVKTSLSGFEKSQADGFFPPGKYYWGIRLFDFKAGQPIALVGGKSLHFEYRRDDSGSSSSSSGNDNSDGNPLE